MNTTTDTKKIAWRQWLPIALILILAAGLYLHQLGTESLWKDELLSVDRAKNIPFFAPRPLSYILLRGWMIFGYSDSWLRGLCVVFTLGSVLLTYRLGCRLVNKPVGLISALFMAISPLFINHAQEVRMYAPSTFFGLLGTLVLTYALESPNKLLIAGWAIARWLAILSTPLNLLLLLPDTVLFAWRFRQQKRVLFGFSAGLVAVCLLWSPWLINVAVSSLDFMGGGQGVDTVDSNAINIRKPSPNIINVLLQPGRFTAWSFGKPNSHVIFWFYRLYSVMVASLIGLAIFDKRNSHKLGWAAAWGCLPLIPIFLVSQISRSLWVDRYLLFTAPYIFILLAAGFMGIWRRWRIPAVAIALIYLVAVGGGLKRYYTISDREDWRGIVQLIQTNEQSGDIIVWSANELIPRALNHYYGGVATIEVRQDQPQDDRKAVETWLQGLPKTQSRIWLVYANPSPTLLSAIEKEFKVEQLYKIYARGTVELFLLAPRDPQTRKKFESLVAP